MIMLRHYYIVDDLDELKTVAQELRSQGITTPQIHVLSKHDPELAHHHLYKVDGQLKRDMINPSNIGTVVGVLSACGLLLIAYLLAWQEGPTGGMSIIFLSLLILGFCIWENDTIGIKLPNINIKQFQRLLYSGKLILFVDADSRQALTVAKVIDSHPHITAAGLAEATPDWLVQSRSYLQRLLK
ncbi:MAG: hypothetical protein ACI86X_001381 [Moritella sp.]|jgi:hypothetical protein